MHKNPFSKRFQRVLMGIL